METFIVLNSNFEGVADLEQYLEAFNKNGFKFLVARGDDVPYAVTIVDPAILDDEEFGVLINECADNSSVAGKQGIELYRKELIKFCRELITSNGCEVIKCYTDKRKTDHPSNIYGRQIKFGIWSSKEAQEKATVAINKAFDKKNLPFVATGYVVQSYFSKPAIRIQRKL